MQRTNKAPIIKAEEIEMRETFIRVASAMDIEDIAESLTEESEEVYQIIYLNSKTEVMATQNFRPDSSNPSILSNRDIFKSALLLDASSLIICHTHGNEKSEPSMLDKGISEQIKQAGSFIGIAVLDSLFVYKNTFKSLNI